MHLSLHPSPSTPALETTGFARTSLFEVLGDASRAAWPAFAASWSDMPVDRYVKTAKPTRFRRFGRFRYSPIQRTLTLLPPIPFFQTTDINSYAGGIERHFEPLAPSTAESIVLHEVLRADAAAFLDRDDEKTWEIGVHQIRVIGRADVPGLPTPEGVHHDGFVFVAMHLIGRSNVSGGETIVRVDGNEVLDCMTQPLDTFLVDDVRCMHGATPIMPLDPAKDAVRDTMIITFEPQ